MFRATSQLIESVVESDAPVVFVFFPGIQFVELVNYQKVNLFQVVAADRTLLCKHKYCTIVARLTVVRDYLVSVAKLSQSPTSSSISEIVGTTITIVPYSLAATSASTITLFPKLVGALRTTFCLVKRSR